MDTNLFLLGTAGLPSAIVEPLSTRVVFFLSGALIALWPLIVFGALGVILIRLHLQNVRADEEGVGAEER